MVEAWVAHMNVTFVSVGYDTVPIAAGGDLSVWFEEYTIGSCSLDFKSSLNAQLNTVVVFSWTEVVRDWREAHLGSRINS